MKTYFIRLCLFRKEWRRDVKKYERDQVYQDFECGFYTFGPHSALIVNEASFKDFLERCLNCDEYDSVRIARVFIRVNTKVHNSRVYMDYDNNYRLGLDFVYRLFGRKYPSCGKLPNFSVSFPSAYCF